MLLLQHQRRGWRWNAYRHDSAVPGFVDDPAEVTEARTTREHLDNARKGRMQAVILQKGFMFLERRRLRAAS